MASPALLLASGLIAACGGGGADGSVDAAMLCVASDCATKTRLLDIPDAENSLFTPEGRLFVSGGQNVYEITRDGETLAARPLLAGSCNFTGLAQRGTTLYAACFDGRLYAATLDNAVALAPIHELGVSAPNGMAVGTDGALYIVNGPLASNALPDPKILRLRFDPADPLRVTEQTDWLTGTLEFPNGLVRRGDTLYVTDAQLAPPVPGLIRRIPIGADGSAGAPETLAEFDSLLDDLSLAGDHLLVALYSGNAIALVSPQGAVVSETNTGSFDSPSSVRQGQPPLFAATDLLVTEKGTIGEGDSMIGNALSVFR